ncbi:3D domain-containing protein [Virgibacillus oceani]
MIAICMFYMITVSSSLDPVEFEKPETEVSSAEVVNENDLGEFTITAYTAGYESTGKHPDDPAYGITATGTTVQEGRTIAADWNVLPPGTQVEIEGFEGTFTVEDKGGAINGKHIDVYMPDLDEAISWGKRKRNVTVVE